MLIHAKIIPDSKVDEVTEKSNVSFIVKVKEPAERNRANVRMLALLASHLKVSRNKLKIITGHHMSSKIIEIVEN